MSITPSPSKTERAGSDYAGDAYRACLYGCADRRQQQSAAAQISGLHGLNGEFMRALMAVDAQTYCECPEWTHGQRIHQPGCFVPLVRAVIKKATQTP